MKAAGKAWKNTLCLFFSVVEYSVDVMDRMLEKGKKVFKSTISHGNDLEMSALTQMKSFAKTKKLWFSNVFSSLGDRRLLSEMI